MTDRGLSRQIRSFRDLEVWQKSMTLAELTFAALNMIPPQRAVALADQMRRACVSVPSNIAEGHQLPPAAYRRHITVALGSLAELDTQLELAVRIGVLSDAMTGELRLEASRLRQMLLRLRAALSERVKQERHPRTSPRL